MPDKLNRRGQLTRDTAALLLVDHQVGLYLRNERLVLTNLVQLIAFSHALVENPSKAYEQTRDGLRLPGARRDREPSRGPLVYAVHGLMTSTPQSSKSFTLRVARLAPRERAIATIMASNWLIGLPAVRREAAISAYMSAASLSKLSA